MNKKQLLIDHTQSLKTIADLQDSLYQFKRSFEENDKPAVNYNIDKALFEYGRLQENLYSLVGHFSVGYFEDGKN